LRAGALRAFSAGRRVRFADPRTRRFAILAGTLRAALRPGALRAFGAFRLAVFAMACLRSA